MVPSTPIIQPDWSVVIWIGLAVVLVPIAASLYLRWKD